MNKRISELCIGQVVPIKVVIVSGTGKEWKELQYYDLMVFIITEHGHGP